MYKTYLQSSIRICQLYCEKKNLWEGKEGGVSKSWLLEPWFEFREVVINVHDEI